MAMIIYEHYLKRRVFDLTSNNPDFCDFFISVHRNSKMYQESVQKIRSSLLKSYSNYAVIQFLHGLGCFCFLLNYSYIYNDNLHLCSTSLVKEQHMSNHLIWMATVWKESMESPDNLNYERNSSVPFIDRTFSWRMQFSFWCQLQSVL